MALMENEEAGIHGTDGEDPCMPPPSWPLHYLSDPCLHFQWIPYPGDREVSKHLVSGLTQSKGSIVTSCYFLNKSENQSMICPSLNPFYYFLLLFIGNSSFLAILTCLPSPLCSGWAVVLQHHVQILYSHVLALCCLVCELTHSLVHLTFFSATWSPLSCHLLMETFPDS